MTMSTRLVAVVFAAGAALSFGVPVASAEAASTETQPLQAGRSYYFENVAHGGCLTDINGKVVRKDCNNNQASQWLAASPGVLQNMESGKCMTTDGAELITATCTDKNTSMRFKSVQQSGGHRVEQTQSRLCVEARDAETVDGGYVVMASCTDENLQLFKRTQA